MLEELGGTLEDHVAPLAQAALGKGAEIFGNAADRGEEFVQDFADSYKKERSAACASQSPAEDAFRIPPWYILAGLGSLQRKALCDFLAIFECASLGNLAVGRMRDLWGRVKSDESEDRQAAFLRQVQQVSDEHYASDTASKPDKWLRYRIWTDLRANLGLKPALPLSSLSASYRCSELADQASRHYAEDSPLANDEEGFARRLGKFAGESISLLKQALQSERRDFTRIVRQAAAQALLQALESDQISRQQRQELAEEFRSRLHGLPSELRDRSLEAAVNAGDWATVLTVSSAGSLAGLAVAVELAGFSAYIVAAQASAVIPFMSGGTAVSLLAVLSSPLFVLPAVFGGAYFANQKLTQQIGQQVASGLAIQLTLHGLAAQADGLKHCLDDFKSLDDRQVGDDRLAGQRAAIKESLGTLRPTPGRPETKLPALSETLASDAVSAVLFPDSRRTTADAIAVTGLTAADVLFDAASIDPRVIQAADFTRSADIDSIFKFGSFAERWQEMEGLARIGTEAQLRGYVAELVVASRLSDHDVSLPDSHSQAGYDLMVDGIPFQVKCYADESTGMQALAEHFEKYPDIPVYINSELLPAVQASGKPWADSVYGVEGFDYEFTDLILSQSLAAGSRLMDTQIPVYAIAISAARNAWGWWKGSVSLRDLPLEVAVDATIHGTLAAAGGFSGAGLGLLLFGPAGGVILSGAGQFAAILGSDTVRSKFDDWRAGEWAQEVGEAAEAFRKSLHRAIQAKLDRNRAKAASVAASDAGLEAWLRLKFADREIGLAEYRAALAVLPEQPVDKARELLRLMREAGVHSISVKAELTRLIEVLDSRPSVMDQVSEAAGSLFDKGPVRSEDVRDS